MNEIASPGLEAPERRGEAAGVLSRKGLQDVIVADTVLSYADKTNRRLIIRGINVKDLILSPNFEEACSFLWQDLIPGGMNKAALSEARHITFSSFLDRRQVISGLAPLDAIRVLLSILPGALSRRVTPVEVVAGVGVAAAFAIRVWSGGEPIPPDRLSTHAADILRMIRGTEAETLEIRAFETYLVTMFEHSMNASTFAARVVASTQAGTVASVSAALAALRGPLHGGAISLVLDMLDNVRSQEEAHAFVQNQLAQKKRIFGFGSRGYEGRDPRTDIFKDALIELAGSSPRLQIAEAVEQAILKQFRIAKPGYRIETNVEYYASLLLEALNIPRSGLMSIFAASRSAGWVAHIREEEKTGRLMRPEARYIGLIPDLEDA